ncbi:hypothetical protein FCH28_14910 [Streptomyces piniterrae]|uniref:Nucleotidyltransferase domain-containing protein n=1 Tax=Streptomyces piniterrae TaxID=2571125 RepID=A0A4U0NJE4_9ACTN|nr:hypothetical protein [Streptomyces piniterrae]TJZ54419.1 hypothetical protein FCH28_14910 [Streptomyces piniterrae]
MIRNAAGAGLPIAGWQSAVLPLLGDFAAQDARIHSIRPYGSGAGEGDDIDRWSDLDVEIVTPEPATVAEAFAERVESRLAPVFASSRSGDARRHTLRLVLVDLRRIDITAVVPMHHTAAPPPGETAPDKGSPMAELANDFRFDAVLAATKAARDDMLIGGHLTLQLARHVLVAAMLLRDREAGTTHHRFGGTRWDAWAAALKAAPAPYTRCDITAAVRHYTNALEELLAAWDPEARPDHGPLLALLDAVDAVDAHVSAPRLGPRTGR